MKPTNAKKLNKLLIPKWFCHRYGLHRWFWTARNKSFISGRCARCGMNGVEFWKREHEEYSRDAKKKS